MPIYVKDGGTWREISSDAGTQLYVRDSTSFTNKTIGAGRESLSLITLTSAPTIGLIPLLFQLMPMLFTLNRQ